MNVKIKIGCDIVKIDRIKKIMQNNNSVSKIFSNYELSNSHSPESLAGIFAAKEAVLKALQLNPGNWKDIEIIKKENGKPEIKLLNYSEHEIISHDISISHDDEYAFATSCFLLKTK